LQKAQDLAKSAVGTENPDVKKTFDRVRFRIETRQILDPAEYDRRIARPQPGPSR